jgi:hypothetical protein
LIYHVHIRLIPFLVCISKLEAFVSLSTSPFTPILQLPTPHHSSR